MRQTWLSPELGLCPSSSPRPVKWVVNSIGESRTQPRERANRGGKARSILNGGLTGSRFFLSNPAGLINFGGIAEPGIGAFREAAAELATAGMPTHICVTAPAWDLGRTGDSDPKDVSGNPRNLLLRGGYEGTVSLPG